MVAMLPRARALPSLLAALLLVLAAADAIAQRPAPNRRSGEGDGPHQMLVIRGAILIDGTGGPPRGPVDITVRGNRITSVIGAGTPGVPQAAMRPIQGATREIDARGMYVMPGFVDLHTHTGGEPKAPDAEYVYKLWLAHGVTAVRDAGSGATPFMQSEKARSAKNEIAAPRIFAYARPSGAALQSPEAARAWVQNAAKNGVDGLKLDAYAPEIMEALIDESKKQGLGTMAHLSQGGVAQMNAIDAARLGLGTLTHFYGLFESLYKDHDIQPWPVDMNASDEQHRFAQVARQWNLIHPRGSEPWNALLKELRALDMTIDPTMQIYSAGRDVMRARTAEWHERYTLPSLMEYYEPNRRNHGSYWFYWTTADEIAWRNFYHVWMQFLNDYKNMGGRVTVGTDAGFIYSTYGFAYPQEMEMLQEAGFHPLEVVRAATMHGAQTLYKPKGKPIEFGVVRPGMLADLVVVDANPLENFKVLYGTGAVKLNDSTGRVERVGGVKYTIKDGIVYDAKQMLADVAKLVEEAKRGARAATPERR